MKVLGIDFSLNGTGLSIFDGKNCIFHKVFSTKKDTHENIINIPNLEMYKKLDWVCNEILNCTNYEAVCLEDHIGSYYDWMDGYAILKYELRKKEIPYITVAPNRLKKFVNSGKLDKIQMAYFLRQDYQIDFDELGSIANNIVDATWLSILGYYYFNEIKCNNKERSSIIKLIREGK